MSKKIDMVIEKSVKFILKAVLKTAKYLKIVWDKI